MTDGASMRLAATLFALLCAPACKRPPQGACPFDLSGTWVNANDERYGYLLVDKGDEITGEFFLRNPDGSRLPRPSGEAPVTLTLRRGTVEVAGVMTSPAKTPKGRECRMDFSIKLAACQRDTLQVQGELSAPLTESCERLKGLPDGGAIPPDLIEYQWVRQKTDKR
jgi:hypothetical protein